MSSAPVLFCADSAFYGSATIRAAIRAGAAVSVTARMDPAIKRAIAFIPDNAWEPIEYPNAIFDADTQRWVSAAEVAEVGPAEALDRPYVDRHDQPVLRSWVESALSGGRVDLTDADYRHVRERPAYVGDEVMDEVLERNVAQRGSGPLTDEERYALVDAHWAAMNEPPEPGEYRGPRRPRGSLAESRAAKRLSIRPLELQQRAIQLWGRSLEAEALGRAGTDSTPQARGRVTRVLVDEVQESMKEGH